MQLQLALLTVLLWPVMAGHHGHHDDDHHISHQEYDELRHNYTFVSFFDKSVIEVCYPEFFDHCLPRLHDHPDAYNFEFRPVRHQCGEDFCNCSGADLRHCEPIVDKTSSCPVVDRCWPNFKKCIGRWIYTPMRLPVTCRDFLHCTRSPKAVSQEDHNCDKQMKDHPSCDAAQGCNYVVNPAGPPVPPPTAAPTSPPTSAPAKSPLGLPVVIVCLVTGGTVVLLVGSLALYSRLKRRRNVVPGLSTQIQVQVADPVKWYGAGQMVGNGVTTCSIPRCESAVGGKPAKRLLVLPCRCEWCGCDERLPSDPQVAALPSTFIHDVRVRCYPGTARGTTGKSKEDTYQCRGCSAPVEAIVDLAAVYVDESDASESFAIPGIEAPMCCICFSEPVRVVAMPCGHLSTCSTCAHRLCKPVPRRGATASAVEVASHCPKCRATTSAMVVLEDDQLQYSVSAACSRERPALN